MLESLFIFAFIVASYGVFLWIIRNDRKARVRDQVGILSMRIHTDTAEAEWTSGDGSAQTEQTATGRRSHAARRKRMRRRKEGPGGR